MPRIGSLYENNLMRHEKDVRFEGPLPGGPGVRVAARQGSVAVEALVDPATHRIAAIHHSGGALLNALSSVSLGYTVQDASEHAAIRLESLLREKPAMRPVAGVVQPENADPAFLLPLALARGLLADYRARTGYSPMMNTEEGPVFQGSSEWGTSTVPERTQRIMQALHVFRLDGFDVSIPVNVKSISGPRVTLDLSPSIPAEVQRRYLTEAEAFLRKDNPRLELFLDDKKDSNAKRHANEEDLGLR